MKFLVLESKAKPGTIPHSLLVEETRVVWELWKQGILREIYFKKEVREAVLILECASRGEAEAHLQSLPLAREGWIAFEVSELTPYDGFERLFG